MVMAFARKFAVLLAALLLAVLPDAEADSPKVDTALVLAIDISASVDADEYRLQMTGLAAALQSPAVLEAIQSGPEKRVAITVLQWSGTNSQHIVVPWTIVEDSQSVLELGLAVVQTTRAVEGGATSLSAALVQATRLFAKAPMAQRKVIDLSADGINNIGPDLEGARLAALVDGVTVNGLAIANEWPKLQEYLETRVIAGTGAFAVTAKSYIDYGAVMQKKLVREIQAPGSS